MCKKRWGGVLKNDPIKNSPNLQLSYLKLHKILRSQCSNLMRILYIAGFISYLSLIPSLKQSQSKDTCMIIMDCLSIRGGYIPYCYKQSIWCILYAFMDAHIQRLIDEYPGGGLQYITILKSQCANINFSDKSRYNRLFWKVVHKVGE